MVIPSEEGIQAFSFLFWIPAFAGMTLNRRIVNSIFMVCTCLPEGRVFGHWNLNQSWPNFFQDDVSRRKEDD